MSSNRLPPWGMGTVRRAYLVSVYGNLKYVERVLVDERSFVFRNTGHLGRCWTSLVSGVSRLVFLPGSIPYVDWWDGWWTTNWALPDWSWLYTRPDTMAVEEKR